MMRRAISFRAGLRLARKPAEICSVSDTLQLEWAGDSIVAGKDAVPTALDTVG